MSRNFDLLTELERERQVGTAVDPTRVATDRSAVPARLPADEAVVTPEILQLVRRLFLVTGREVLRKVVFCGVESENGSSSICAGVGRALASVSSKSVCLLDGNVVAAPLTQLFGAQKATHPSRKFSSTQELCVQVSHNLWLADSHVITDNQGSLLPVEDVKKCLAELDGAFDYLLIDAPGVISSSDAEFLGQFADAAILVIEADKTRRTAAAKAKESLDLAGIELLGTILNNQSAPIPKVLSRLF
jgi:Mrp family chromosome partitioning ATPase